MARPTSYRTDIAEIICERISAGEFVKDITQEADMPSERTIYSWRSKIPEFAQMYACARENWADAQFEEIIRIASTPTDDTYVDQHGNVKTNHEVLGRSRLHVDTLKWALAKVNSRRYGDKQTTDITNSDGSLAAPADPQLIAQRIEAIYQRALASRPTSDAVFEEIPDDGSDLC